MDHTEFDLLSLLNAYAAKQVNAVITTNAFVQSVIAAVRQKNADNPNVDTILDNMKNKIRKALDDLIRAELVFMEGGSIEKIYVPSFYRRKIQDAYKNIDNSIETSFPDDNSLSIYDLKKHHIKHIDILNSFTDYIAKRAPESKSEIVRMVFFEGYGSLLAISELLPERLLQMSLFKLSDYLTRYGRTDYLLVKLKSYFSGKETLVLDYFKNITTTPEKSMESIISGNNFSTSFWSYLYSLLNAELAYQESLSGGRTKRDITLYQACTIILACNNYYTATALNERDKVLALSSVDEEMGKPPYFYTFDEIKRFKTASGQDILRSYSVQELVTYLKERLKPENDSTMPPILVFRGPNKEAWYARKINAADLCARLVAEAAPLLRTCIEDRWRKIIKNYHTENTMRNDTAFEELVRTLALSNVPHVVSILREPKLEFVFEELWMSGNPAQLELFRYGEPVPLYKILGLERNAILFSIRANLPLRYSLKFIVKIVAYLKHGKSAELVFSKKVKPGKTVKAKPEYSDKDIKNINALAQTLLPEGRAMDDELDLLVKKWNQQPDPSAWQRLREDVDSLIKETLLFEFRTLKQGNFTFSIVEDIARSIVTMNETLKNIRNQKALQDYITLFLVKLMKCRETAPVLKKK
jgi:hypothetical protein